MLLAASLAAELPELPLLGALPRAAELALPSRHLGLVQANEHGALVPFLDRVAALARAASRCRAARGAGAPVASRARGDDQAPLPPLGQRIAVARDPAFAFAYPAMLDGWRAAALRSPFSRRSPTRRPITTADAVFLPGGYPELHAGRIASAA